MNRIGVQGYTIRNYISGRKQFGETLARLRKIGYNCLDHGVPQGMTAAEYRDLLAESGISPLKVNSDVYTLLDHPAGAVEDAHTLGVDLITVLSLPKSMRGSEDGFRRYAADLNRACETVRAQGLRLAYHTHAFDFCSFGGYSGVDILLNETEHVEIVPDTHWAAAGGVNPPDLIRRLCGRCTQVHCKDYAIAAGTDILENVPRLYAEVGQGNLNWPDIVRACRETGIRTYIVEQDDCREDPFTSLEISFRALKALGL